MTFSERQQRTTLNLLRVVGYLNLIVLIYVLLGLKATQVPWPLAVTTPLVAICGAFFYYLAWGRFITSVSKADGRRYMRPYLLGFYLLVSAIALFVMLHWISGTRGS